MRVLNRTTVAGWTRSAVAFAGVVAAADAAEIMVTTNISTSTTWTANNTYNLQQQIYVLPGATLTIQPGTIVASTTDLGGSLAVCKGAQIFVNGTQAKPVIMTSTADVATWTGGNPQTGTWRVEANEWGNLTVMGAAYISENAVVGNTAVPSASNVANMEGLVAGPSTDRYGGGDDDDDSGAIHFLSLRYGGKVVGLNNELNGLSLGGIGRDTDIDHVEIMNNVDDGIEIWGGTVNLKYFSIWNIGDDSFDGDQGWRGKAQFGLIVQGFSVNAAQGSGVGDNAFEIDGAEDSDWQPVTTATIYNCTVIGQPGTPTSSGNGGDHATAWRDNARVQYRNCIFMDIGERVVSFDNQDGDGANGYGFNGTLSWASTWTTAYNGVPAHANDFTTGTYATNYAAQTSGRLAEITDSVFFRNEHGSAYTEATARDVFNVANNNVQLGSLPADLPIKAIARGPGVILGSLVMNPVISLDPRPDNDALTSVAAAPNDGFFTPAQYRGAFAPDVQSWLAGWTASTAFGFTTEDDPGTAFCFPGQSGIITCPCNNAPTAIGKGCNNFGAGPADSAEIGAAGIASIASDTVVLTATGENNTSTTIFLQSPSSSSTGLVFGAGVRCLSGSLKRLYTGPASAGTISRPQTADPAIHTRSAALGDPFGAGASRFYMNYYRDPNAATACSNAASTFNCGNSYKITWAP